MKNRLKVVLAIAGIAAILLAGCVPSKKYKASQAALQQVRSDSTRLAQQVTSLNDNIHAMEAKNTALQRSLDSSSSAYATQQKSLDYYSNYFNQLQSNASQVSEELKGAMSQAGLSNEDVSQVNNTIYVRLDEAKVFKKNSTAVTTSGKQALNSLAQVIKNRSNMNVFVSDGESSGGQAGVSENSIPSARENAEPAHPAPKHKAAHHEMAARKSAEGNAAKQNEPSKPANESQAANPQQAKDHTAVAHMQHKRPASERPLTYVSNGRRPESRSWALKTARMHQVATSFLENGVPKVNLSLEQSALHGNPSNNIKVVIVPSMSDFNPQRNASASTESK